MSVVVLGKEVKNRQGNILFLYYFLKVNHANGKHSLTSAKINFSVPIIV